MEDTSAMAHSTAHPSARFTADRLVIEPIVERLGGRLGCITKRGVDAVVAIVAENEGEAAGIFTAALVLDGEVMGWRDVRVAPGERKQVKFLLGNLSSGTHWVSLAGFTGTFTTSQRINWPAVAVLSCAAVGVGVALACRRSHTHCR